MGPRPIYGGGYDSEDDEIPRYSDRSGRPERHGSLRASERPRKPGDDGDHEGSEYAIPSRRDRDIRHGPSPCGYADNRRESRQPRGAHCTRARPLDHDDDVLYYARYRNPAKVLPIERDPEGIDMFEVRQHTRPGRPRECSGYCESYKVQADGSDDDPFSCARPGLRDYRQPEVYKVQVEEYEDDLPPRSHIGRRESTQLGWRSGRYADDLEPGELPPRSGPRGSSRPSRVDEDVDYEIREPRGYRSSHAARGDDSYQDHNFTHVHIEERGPHESRAGGCRREPAYSGHGRGQDRDGSDDVDAQARKFTDMLPDMFSKFNINPDR
ncbi:hypothetical protein BDW71DRAFT_202448 [Aspergillus fruticulosus]